MFLRVADDSRFVRHATRLISIRRLRVFMSPRSEHESPFQVQPVSVSAGRRRTTAKRESQMNLLAVSDDVSALLVAIFGLLASISLAFWAYQKGEAGKQSLEVDSAIVLTVDSRCEQDSHAKKAA